MTGPLKDQTVLTNGRGSGLARPGCPCRQDAGTRVIADGRNREILPAAYAGEPGVSTDSGEPLT